MLPMKDLIILGIDIHGLEIADIVNSIGEYRIIGFISGSDDFPSSHGGYPVLGNASALANFPHAMRVPMHTWKDTDTINWVNIIAPSAFIASTAKLGVGCVIYPNCFIGAKAKLGNGVFMLSGSIVNHDNIIEDRVIITSGVSLAGSVTVKSGAYLGQACNVRQYLTIGQKSTVGMGAVVTRDVPDNVTVIGCPAKPYERGQKQ